MAKLNKKRQEPNRAKRSPLQSETPFNPSSDVPNWQNVMSVYDGVIRTEIDHKTRTIRLVPVIGKIFVAPKPIKINGKWYKYEIAEPDTRVPDRFRPFYEQRHAEYSLETLVRCFLPMLYLNYNSMNTFLPVRGVYDRKGENSVAECIPHLKAEAEFAVSIGKLPAHSQKKKPFRVTPIDFVTWLVESKYSFIGDAWVKPLLESFKKAKGKIAVEPEGDGKRGRKRLTAVQTQIYRDIFKNWTLYAAKHSRAKIEEFRDSYELSNGETPSVHYVRKALNWVGKNPKE